MLTYGEVLEIGEKGERLGFWRMAYPTAPDGLLGIRVLGDRWEFLPVSDLEAMAELQPIIAEIRAREAVKAARKVLEQGLVNDGEKYIFSPGME